MSIQHTIILAAAIGIASVSQSLAADFDGTWSGRWNGGSSAQIQVAGDKVTAYRFNGQKQRVGATRISGDTLTFGSDFTIVLKRTSNKSANATYSGPYGKASAKLTRN